MVTISVCMIVKNEEEVLARGLDSLQGIYDELIIIDTGSADHTKEIARKYTDQVYDYTWIDDFSAARNFMFSKCTKEYIYVADADEVIEDSEREKFLKLKQVLLPEIEIVQMKYSNQLEYNTTYNYDLEYRPKLYKRLRTFVWKDPIHESVVLDPIIFDSDVMITHRPTSNHGKRDFAIFQKVIKNEGKLSKKLQQMYARELYITGSDQDFITAYPYFCQLIEETTEHKDLAFMYAILVKCARLKDDCMEILSICTKVFAGELSSSEVCYELGEYFFNKGKMQDAILWFYNAAYECQSELNLQYQKRLPLIRLADCYALLNRPDDEVYYRTLVNDLD